MKTFIPYFNLYPGDFMNGVRGLSAQEVGVFIMLLCRIYEENGPTEYHALRLATYCGMRRATFEAVVKKLIELGKLTLTERGLSNARAEAEIAKRSAALKNNSKAGKASAEKRQQNQQMYVTPVQQPFNHSDTDTDTDTDTEDADDTRAGVLPKVEEAVTPKAFAFGQVDQGDCLRGQILTALGVDPITGITVTGVFLGTQSDMHCVKRWQGDLALTDEEIIAQINDVMRRARQNNATFVPSRFSYFNRPMAEYAGLKSAPTMQSTSDQGGQNGQYHGNQSNGQPQHRHGAVLTAGFAAVAARIGRES